MTLADIDVAVADQKSFDSGDSVTVRVIVVGPAGSDLPLNAFYYAAELKLAVCPLQGLSAPGR